MLHKRGLAALLALLLAVSLSACSGDKNETTGDDTTVETTIDETTEETTEETTQETTEETTQETTQETTKTTEKEQTPVYNTGSHAITGSVPESGRVSSSYFDDVVFVGDSVSLKLSYYEASVDALGGAQFLTSGSLGSGNALWSVSSESVHPSYQGQKMLLEESVPKTGAKKLYIMLGMNDIAVYGINGSVDNMKKLIGKIKAAVPDMKIYIQSMTPMTSTSNIMSSGGLNPKNVHTYNQALAAACQSNGWYFVNVAEIMYDSNGYLRNDYCSDSSGMGIHFTDTGCKAWIEYLYTHTAG